MTAYECFPDESGGLAQRDDVVPLYAVPLGWSFCRPWDGWNVRGGFRDYYPRDTYLRRNDGTLRACKEFGGVWTLDDCGLTEETLVRLFSWHGKAGW